jgi:hypothetical protein
MGFGGDPPPHTHTPSFPAVFFDGQSRVHDPHTWGRRRARGSPSLSHLAMIPYKSPLIPPTIVHGQWSASRRYIETRTFVGKYNR